MQKLKLIVCGLLAVLLVCTASACTIIINSPGGDSSAPASEPESAQPSVAQSAEESGSAAPESADPESEEPSEEEPAAGFAADNDAAKERVSSFLADCDYAYVKSGSVEGCVYRDAVRKEDGRYYGARYSAENGKTYEVYTRGTEVMYNERTKIYDLPTFCPVTSEDGADAVSYNALKQFAEVFLKRAVENAEDANALLAVNGTWKELPVQNYDDEAGGLDPEFHKITYDGLTISVYLENKQIRVIEYEVSGETGTAYYAEFRKARGDLYSPMNEDRSDKVPGGRVQAFFDSMYNALAPVRPAKG